jgi:hypothetical protein
MVPEAPASGECPLPNVLSEQEVLLKAADAAVKDGVLDPSYYEYQNYPALRTAKLETPILVIDAERGDPGSYLLTAVDDKGIYLARVTVNPAVNARGEKFEFGRIFADPGTKYHYITKREAAELIQSQFPDKAVSEPMAITNLRLEGDKYGHMFLFWHFTVSDDAQAAGGTVDEYIIAAVIPGYTAIPGGVSNRAAIDYAGGRGDFHLKGYRMARLNEPLRLFNRLVAARSAGGASFSPSRYPDKQAGFTPVPLK